ncbi:GH92 family glycosyl hydrolase [uncultured Draconibacterium sp.]|uniref:GH92 family glycosyl hydrolase n=1 Tax=uncultured Draconibacterium sp. TaxID=1573823 RepID=UPI0029C003E7|nr:GH92 family glycosyl hydrolase [uncultured Draconibacterium sp.]
MKRLNNQNILALIIVIALVAFTACNQKTEKNQKDTIQPLELVYNQLDTENSRWFLFSSACRPFGMVNLSPDTQIGGAWGSGYRYLTDTVKGFSHIHAWQLSGLSVMPVSLTKENKETIFTNFYSHFSHDTEKVSPGYHYLNLDRYNIDAEITSTTRVGFHKYTYRGNGKPALLLNLNTLLGPCENMDGVLHKTGQNFVSGEVTNAPTRRRPKTTKVFFKIESDVKIVDVTRDKETGNYLLSFEQTVKQIQLKAGISYTSIENAATNIQTELAGWDFESVVAESKNEWNELLNRIQIKGGTETQQKRFYTDLWHGLQGRRIISDANGAYPDYTGDGLRVGQIQLGENGKPKFNHYNSDAFWGAQWTINTLWGLVYPEVYKEFVQSLMLYYKDGGMVPRGPSGGNYTYVMTGASATPFVVSAIQKGIVTDDLEEIYQALKKGHMPGGIMAKAGYEHETELGGGLDYYINNGWVPHPIPEGKFGYHQDGASLTMEYAYQDWTLAQLAKKLGHSKDYEYFMKRSENYKNIYDKETTWMRPRDVNGKWLEDFDPYNYEHGFNESNGAQSTWFVPHDLIGLAELMGGKEKAVEKLNQQFETAEEINFTSGTSHDKELHPEYKRIPINYGNQPSIQTAFIFNKLGRPDLSQYWARKVVDKAFSGFSPASGYNGDEDQGLMGSLAVLMKIGLFQMTGGTEDNPEYQIGSTVFDEVKINLSNGNTLLIKTENNSAESYKVNSAIFNGNKLESLVLKHEDFLEGGELVLLMENL